MPAGGTFWPPRGNGNGKPFRRRRSLLGRKNRSDNDLPHQAQPPQQQQNQTPVNHTTLVQLPDNVRTILIAGTPECWNLSTSAEAFVPEACDASLLTYGSELTPGSLTIDEEESYHGSPPRQQQQRQQQQQQVENLDWLRVARPSPSSARRKAGKEQQVVATKEPSSMVVMYSSPTQNPGSPQEALHLWLSSVEGLMRSKEMANLVHSTHNVVKVAGGLAVKTAFLPVTLPLHVACATKDFVGWTVHQALSQTTGAILHLTNGEHHQQGDHPSPKQPAAAESKDTEEEHGHNPLEGLLHLVPVVLQTAGKVKDEIGSAFIGLVAPPQPKRAGQESTDKDKEVLDRLKIPIVGAQGNLGVPAAVVVSTTTTTPTSVAMSSKADFSKYLLRVDDLGVSTPEGVVLYVDLSADVRDDTLLAQCLDKLASQGLALATLCAPAIPPATTLDDSQLEWKPEGATAKLLRKKARQTTERWEETIRSEVLIWSGSFKKGFGGSSIHRQFPLFLARGIVERLSPREFLELLWNNERTCEYNNFCMGRKDAIQIDDNVLSSPNVHSGVKVVRSETRVPFTGLSVSLCTVMHCRPLPKGPQEGYVIFSRSLVSGMAGNHHTSQKEGSINKSKSEILWGVNMLRAVPGHPGQTELTSVSQVASSIVPKFLSQRIGIMGVEDFFRNVRNGPKVTNDTPTPAASPSSTQVKKAATPISPTANASCVSV